MRLTTTLVTVTVALTMAGAAHATVYSFTAGVDAGTFTTGGQEPTFPTGYNKLVDIDFTALDDGGTSLITADATSFDEEFVAYSASENNFLIADDGNRPVPTSFSFNSQDGDVTVNNVDGPVAASNFSTGTINDQFPFTVTGIVAPVAAAPEPSTWLLMILGIGGMGLMLHRVKHETGFTLTA